MKGGHDSKPAPVLAGNVDLEVGVVEICEDVELPSGKEFDCFCEGRDLGRFGEEVVISVVECYHPLQFLESAVFKGLILG